MGKPGIYDMYDLDNPFVYSRRNRTWLENKIKNGMPAHYAALFCVHAIMVGKPRASESRKTGKGCGCVVEQWMETYGFPETVAGCDSYDEWMEKVH